MIKTLEAIIPVHLFGLPVDMNRLMELAKEYDLRVIEDACQAINANIEINTEMSVDHPDHKELMSVKSRYHRKHRLLQLLSLEKLGWFR